MSDAIPAATILLLRDRPAFEVLMVERHANINFAGGALVFPGGRIDKGDGDARWKDHCHGFDDTPKEQSAPKIAAIREAFEETGILLARKNGDDAFVDDAFTQSIDHWRAEIEADDAKFLDLVRQKDLRLAGDALCLFARWSPPVAATHKRFDTWFFAAHTPVGQQAREDGNEATEAVWLEPKAALEAREKQERKMIFPTVRNVELLNVSNSADDVFAFAKTRTINPVQPVVIERDGQHFVTIPEGLGYPITEEDLVSAMRT